MTLVDLNSNQFYRPPTEAKLLRKKALKTSTAHGLTAPEREIPPKTLGPSNECNILWGDSPIKNTNIANSPFEKHLSLLREEAPNLKMSCDIRVFNHDTAEDDNSLSLLEELFPDSGEISKSKKAGPNEEVEDQRPSDKIQSEGDEATDLEFTHGKNTGKYMGFMYQ